MSSEIHENVEQNQIEQRTVKDVSVDEYLSISEINSILQSPYKDMGKNKNNDLAKEVEDEGVEKDVENYLEELKTYSEHSETIPLEPFNASELKKRSPEDTQALRKQFNIDKDNLIKEWEEINKMSWPVYENDIKNQYGDIVRCKGWKYDAHHIMPLSMGGDNVANNITPLRYDVHSDHKGVHAYGSPYDILDKKLKEAM